MGAGGQGPAERPLDGQPLDGQPLDEQQPTVRASASHPGLRQPTRAVDSPDERLLPAERLRRRADFQRCYRQGRRLHGSLVSLHFIDNKEAGNTEALPRLGITVTRKVGNSVVRHRLKRQVREIYRRWPKRRRLPAQDLVVHLKPAARHADFKALEVEVLRLLRRVGGRRGGRRGRLEERADEER